MADFKESSAGGFGDAHASADSPKPHGDKLAAAGRGAAAEDRAPAGHAERERRLSGHKVGPDVEPAGS